MNEGHHQHVVLFTFFAIEKPKKLFILIEGY